jgi:uncharacterized membrane protein YdbT with pleckstrin-like domain
MVTKAEEWEKTKRARDQWLERMFFIGIIGIITIIANIPSLDMLKTHYGTQIAIIVYAIFLGTCLFKVIRYQKRMSRIPSHC